MKNLQISYLKNKYDLNLKPETDFYIKESHWLPRRLGIQFIAFGKTLYCSGEIENVPDHEFLHIVQFRRFGVPRVVAHYLFHLAKNFISTFNFSASFKEIPFEKEARYYEQVLPQERLNTK